MGAIDEALITSDALGRILAFDALAETFTGWTVEDAAGQPLEHVVRLLSPVDRKPILDPVNGALRSGEPRERTASAILVARDGSERSVAVRVVPTLDKSLVTGGCVLVLRNLAERIPFGGALPDPPGYAESILETLRDPFIVLDRNLRVKTANRAFYEKFHVTPKQTEGRELCDLGDGQWDIPRLRALLQRVLEEREPIEAFDVEHAFPDIGRKSMLLNARPFPPRATDFDLILLAIEDVTDRKRSEQALQASELQYRRLFESAKDGILILDAISGRIIDANPYMSWLLGYDREEFLGQELWEIGLFPDQSENAAAFRQLQDVGYVRYDHLPLADKAGGQAEVEFVSNIYQVDDRMIAQCNIRDIRERVRMEQRMAEQTETLADLHTRKDEFLAMLSHELRNPLTPIVSALQLLHLQDLKSPVERRCREILERQVGNLKQIVDDLLEVTRITTGKVVLRRKWCDLRRVAEGALETVRPQIDGRGHTLSVSMSPEPILVEIDPERMEQVLTNLLTNAAKYTEDGGQIAFELESAGAECLVRVRDTGVGIASEFQPRLFDLFSQAARSLDRSGGGLGIGLCLVARLVELHGGTVDVSSELGRGSEFRVRLPLKASAHQASSEPLHPAAANLAPPKPVRILVVDDNLDAAESLAMLARAFGHEVRMAHDGPGAIRAALTDRPGVILLDIGLPGYSGYVVAKRLRRQRSMAGTLLIALTGYGRESDRRLALDAGCDHHMVKPVDFLAVQRILSEREARQPLADADSGGAAR